MKQHTPTQTRQFIAFPPQGFGLVVYGIGGGANFETYRGQNLAIYLQNLWDVLEKTKQRLNKMWEKLDRQKLNSKQNRAILDHFLQTGAWAYALVVELAPFAKACQHGPTDPLRVLYLKKLDEIVAQCFSAAHIYGSPEQSVVGLQGLITDFVLNGGVNQKTGETGGGFYLSFHYYMFGHFGCTEFHPLAYERFGELVEALLKKTADLYPKVAEAIGDWISDALQKEDHGFARASITSEAKTAMVKNWQGSQHPSSRIRPRLPDPQTQK